MKPTRNDVFRLISLRGSDPIYAVDPSDDDAGVEVVELLRDVPVDIRDPGAEVVRRLSNVRVLSESDLEDSTLAIAETALRENPDVTTLAELREVRVKVDDDEFALADLAATRDFRTDYEAIANSWLKLLLTDGSNDTLARHEALLRSGHLVHALVRTPDVLAEPNAVQRLRNASIVPPRSWRRSVSEGGPPPGDETDGRRIRRSRTSKKIRAARKAYAKQVRNIKSAEAIRAKAHRTYFAWKRTQLDTQPERPAVERAGLIARGVRALFGSGRGDPVRVRSRLALDQSYYASLDQSLSSRERSLVQTLLGNNRPDLLDGFFDVMEPGQFIEDANDICKQIELWESEETQRLPVAAPSETTDERPLVRAIGWGDLVVVRERLIGYDAREIAHIENVLPGETKLREHERQRTVEQITEIETTRETESERDLQTTDRFELQSESQTTIQQDFSIEAGVNTSGRYGLTQVDTSLEVGFQQSKTEARSSSQQLAREIVSRAVERTFERIRELRRLTITEQIRELNRHRLENATASGGSTPTDISGIYVWVEKLLEVELRQYGTRMLVEFHIPEPALSLLERGLVSDDLRKPAEFTLSPTQIDAGNYLCLASKFGAEDIQPPPPQYIRVGYAWASAPSEDVDEDTAEDSVADTIAIPPGYKPVDGYAVVSAHPAEAQYVDIFMAVGGLVVIDVAGVDFADSDGELEFDPSLAWPNGVPVSMRAHGHFDKTLVTQVSLRCTRTDEALATWRLRTWEQLRTAQEVRTQQYQREKEELALRTSLNGPFLERPESENRRIENEELRKWAIKAMRGTPFDFNSIEQVGDFQEIDPLAGGREAAVARLFEEGFEWDQSSYFLYPYYWSRRDSWKLRMGANAVDARHAAFLRAGSARLIVPVTPGYEGRVLYYLESTGDEEERLNGPPDDEIPADTEFENLWLELLLDRRPEIALGSGTLRVRNGNVQVRINDDSNWEASDRDLGRELYIDGEEYRIQEVAGPNTFTLDEPFQGADADAIAYAAGSVPYGPPWIARVPTSLVILNGRRPDLAGLGV